LREVVRTDFALDYSVVKTRRLAKRPTSKRLVLRTCAPWGRPQTPRRYSHGEHHRRKRPKKPNIAAAMKRRRPEKILQ
jgi:hypothetical protein